MIFFLLSIATSSLLGAIFQTNQQLDSGSGAAVVQPIKCDYCGVSKKEKEKRCNCCGA